MNPNTLNSDPTAATSEGLSVRASPSARQAPALLTRGRVAARRRKRPAPLCSCPLSLGLFRTEVQLVSLGLRGKNYRPTHARVSSVLLLSLLSWNAQQRMEWAFVSLGCWAP